MKNQLMLLYAPGALGPVELLRELRPMADLIVAIPEQYREDPGAKMLGQFLDPVFFNPQTEVPDATGCLGVVCFSDLLARSTAAVAARHGLRGQSESTALSLVDKDVQRRTLAEHGVDTVRSALVSRPSDWAGAVERVGLPAVLKPRTGGGSRHTYRIDEASAGAELVERLLVAGPEGATEAAMVLEELLVGVDQGPHGDYCSVETVTVDGIMTHLPVLSKFRMADPFRETGQFWPTHLDADTHARALEVTEATLRALGSRDGLTSTELKLTPEGPRLIEVNSRLGGFMNEMSIYSEGPNLFVAAAKVAMGQPLDLEFPQDLPLIFQMSHLGPPDAVEFLGVSGLDAVQATQGVLAYRLLRTPGTRMTPGPQSQQLDLLNATSADRDGMYALLRTVARHLTFGFRLQTGSEVWLPGDELPSAAALAPSAGGAGA